MSDMTRREMLTLALGTPFLASAQGRRTSAFDRQKLVTAPGRVIRTDGSAVDKEVELVRQWQGPLCDSRVVNRGRAPVRIKQVILFDLKLTLPPETRLYGEGFQMLSQTGGTLGEPVDLSSLTDAKHYRMPIPDGVRALYGLLRLTSPGGETSLLAFTSCRRFSGQFLLRGDSLQVVVDMEGLLLESGETIELEQFFFSTGLDHERLLEELANRINAKHPPMKFAAPPTGWCSWYCFGARVTSQQVLDNLDFISREAPGLKYIQIDDGYQPAMGDWLETGSAFGGNVQSVLKQIRARGFEPAIWVAPFVAEEGSHLFAQHRDWFVKNADGQPLRSDLVTFGGWRRGPWYALDGTHPEAQRHLETVFRIMRSEWGCSYFKLDANFWGAIHGGRFHDPRATRIEAYRRGMAAIIRGAGDGFILGCNHPMWPSLGLLHGSRSSNDIKRSWERISSTARQNLSRNWQNGRLWWNDPDAVVLTGDLNDEEYRFHATAILATGGMLLSGDDLTKISPARLAMLKRIMPPTGKAARFTDDSLSIGWITTPGKSLLCLFNWSDRPASLTVELARACEMVDFWTGEEIGRRSGKMMIEGMPPHSAKLLVCS